MTDLPFIRYARKPEAYAIQAASPGLVSRLTIAAFFTAIAFGWFTASPSKADSIGQVEGARAKDRAGYHLDRQDFEKLDRYGGNDDGYASYGAYDDEDFDDYDDADDDIRVRGRYRGGYVYREYEDGYDERPHRRVYREYEK